MGENKAISGEKLQIGVGVPLSGRGKALGREMANAVQLAIDEANAAGGLNGRPLEAVILDDQGNEEEGARAVREFLGNPAAVAAIGHYNSNVSLRVAPLYCSAGLALIAPIVSNPALTESGWSTVFRFTNRDDATARAIADYMLQKLGKRRAVLVETDTVYGKSMGVEFAKAFQFAGGSILQRHIIREGEEEFRPLVASFPREADSIFYGGTFEGAPLLKSLRARGDGRLLATGDGCWDVENFLSPAGAAAEEGEGVLVLSACPQLGDVPGSVEFAERYEKRFGPIKNYAVNSFDAARTLIEAVRAAAREGSLTRARVAAALRKTHRQGIAYKRPVRWDDNGDNLSAVTALHEVEGGRFRQIDVINRTAG
jgi:branched-chain amino acid transport system substrate-binding protein